MNTNYWFQIGDTGGQGLWIIRPGVGPNGASDPTSVNQTLIVLSPTLLIILAAIFLFIMLR